MAKFKIQKTIKPQEIANYSRIYLTVYLQTVVPAPCVCRNVMRKRDVIMLREDMNCAFQSESILRIFSGISCCCSNKYSFRS